MQYGNGTRAQWGIKDILLGSLVAGVLFAVGVFAVALKLSLPRGFIEQMLPF